MVKYLKNFILLCIVGLSSSATGAIRDIVVRKLCGTSESVPVHPTDDFSTFFDRVQGRFPDSWIKLASGGEVVGNLEQVLRSDEVNVVKVPPVNVTEWCAIIQFHQSIPQTAPHFCCFINDDKFYLMSRYHSICLGSSAGPQDLNEILDEIHRYYYVSSISVSPLPIFPWFFPNTLSRIGMVKLRKKGIRVCVKCNKRKTLERLKNTGFSSLDSYERTYPGRLLEADERSKDFLRE